MQHFVAIFSQQMLLGSKRSSRCVFVFYIEICYLMNCATIHTKTGKKKMIKYCVEGDTKLILFIFLRKTSPSSSEFVFNFLCINTPITWFLWFIFARIVEVAKNKIVTIKPCSERRLDAGKSISGVWSWHDTKASMKLNCIDIDITSHMQRVTDLFSKMLQNGHHRDVLSDVRHIRARSLCF